MKHSSKLSYVIIPIVILSVLLLFSIRSYLNEARLQNALTNWNTQQIDLIQYAEQYDLTEATTCEGFVYQRMIDSNRFYRQWLKYIDSCIELTPDELVTQLTSTKFNEYWKYIHTSDTRISDETRVLMACYLIKKLNAYYRNLNITIDPQLLLLCNQINPSSIMKESLVKICAEKLLFYINPSQNHNALPQENLNWQTHDIIKLLEATYLLYVQYHNKAVTQIIFKSQEIPHWAIITTVTYAEITSLNTCATLLYFEKNLLLLSNAIRTYQLKNEHLPSHIEVVNMNLPEDFKQMVVYSANGNSFELQLLVPNSNRTINYTW
ncbi:hypothetical protein KS4_18980 [Poriferisphaera corsica]|uniref:Uncharacterized protein n=1 Tax=Poriferisphaera corsica TaxID=2528020 RepID=A0A517YUC9_9BACT|nr:hypothetical protein [Poriferisphaera corsica]QDU33840.1 hypothetical protein KS4_18980 [Poriferisphaera corsica]